MFVNKEINTNLPTFIYPWGSFNGGLSFSKKNQELSRFCGPSSDEFIEEEYKRIIALYEILKVSGYTPRKYPHSYVGGTILIRENGETKFIVMQGNHRVAILSHLGYRNINVRLIPSSLKYVYEKNVYEWIMVKKNLCNEKDAIKIFNLFFEENGNHIKNYIHSL
jgi:hypothetical protein